MELYQHLSPDYQDKVLKRWKPVLEAGKPIKSEAAALATALVLENTQREFEGSLLKESFTGTVNSTGGFGSAAGSWSAASGAGTLGSASDLGVNDSRIPTIIIPTIRRIFPELIAHDVVGVQPMTGPVGFAFALRAQYALNQRGTAGSTNNSGTELGYNTIDSTFTGASGLTSTSVSANYSTGSTVTGGGAGVGLQPVDVANAYWQAFAGSAAAVGDNTDGNGASLASSEWWKVGEDMPMTKFVLEKGIVEAKSRKLAAHWSLELAEDMMKMHGVDVDSEMVNIMSYEIQAEIDRQLLGEMVKSAIGGGLTSTFDPISADGRHQLERIAALYTQVLIKSQDIAIKTRRGHANFLVASPTVVALLERVSDFAYDAVGGVAVDANNIGIARVGTLRQGAIKVYRDTFAGGNYVLLGYKGPTAYDSGIVYCPYIPIQLLRAIGPQDFSPRIGVRTRYGVLNNLFGSGNYYHMIAINNLTSGVLGDSSNGRVFTF